MDFISENYSRFIIAKHKIINRIILIKVVSKREYEPFIDLKPTLMELNCFKNFIRRIIKIKKETFKNISNLNTDVITQFGWHAYEDENVRREALCNSVECWGQEHIFYILRLMRNTWPNNERLERYSDVVIDDFDWFHREHSKYSYSYLKRMSIITQLKKQVQSRLLSSFKIIKDINEVNHWIIVYS
jgi:hypothetical protein